LTLALWAWLLWKIWTRPRQWGLGVAIFLFLMVAFQSYLWWLGIHNPALDKITTGRSATSFILLYELPIFAAATYCTLLRFFYRGEPLESTSKAALTSD
jgi:hypothetical protein